MNSLKYETYSLTDKLYNQIAANGKKTFLRGGNIDLWLNKPDIDSRMSVALLFRPDKYIKSNILNLIKEMRKFEGLTYSDSAIMIKGYYTNELECLRQQLRQSIPEIGLDLEERYETKSCHITLARFPKKIHNPLYMLNFIEQNNHFPIGTFTVNKLELVFHNWYDSKKELLGGITW